MRIFIFVVAVICVAMLFLIWKNLTVPKTVGIVEGELYPCPKSPNCVESCRPSDETHSIEPLPILSEDPLSQIERIIKENYDAAVIQKTQTYMHVVVTTPLCRYRDDLEFLVDQDKKVVCVRSASRVGYGDGNTNRKRIEVIRKNLEM